MDGNSTSDTVTIEYDCNSLGDEAYNLGVAISSVFVVFIVSMIGFLTPVFLKNKKSSFFQISLVACACGGTGVVLTVGFVHILGDAGTYLKDPCLPQSFLDAFPSWADLACNVTIICLILVDFLMRYLFEQRMRHKVKIEDIDLDCHSGHRENDQEASSEASPTRILMNVATGSDSSVHGTQSCGVPQKEDTAIQSMEVAVQPDQSLALTNDVILARGSLLFIEMSVSTHSIPVGLALGLQKGSSFTSLFIAVVFHQILEGFGIGVAAMRCKYPFKIELLLAATFSITAPIGIIMGICLQQSLNQHSTGYLLTVGFINAIAAGMLIYIGLEHMNAISQHGKWLRKQPWAYQFYCLGFFVLASVALMVVGKWA
jgi:zinc transporter 1/2/3